MQQRPSKIRSMDAVNAWTLAEMGTGRGKKVHKALIRRKRRVLEKREANMEFREVR